jgi:hypothetical protein
VAARIKRARAEREQRADFFRETKEVIEGALRAPDASSFAAPVLLAARKARGEVADDAPRFSDDKHGRFARAVVNAGRRRRGEKEIS